MAGRLFEGLAVWVPLRFAPPEVTPGEWQQVELGSFRHSVWILFSITTGSAHGVSLRPDFKYAQVVHVR